MATNGGGELEVTVKAVVRDCRAGGLACVWTRLLSVI
jgi:hypothetical protein